jgi:hypothetical protein
MNTNATNAQTPRTTNPIPAEIIEIALEGEDVSSTCEYCGHAPEVRLDPQFGACEECYEDVRADACWAEHPRYRQDDD